MTYTCSLAITAARTDVAFIRHTIPHFVHSCNYPFSQKVLVADTGSLSGEFSRRPGRGTIKQLLNCGNELITANVIDDIKLVDYSEPYRKRVYNKHFGQPLPFDHDERGSPILSYVFSIEEAKSDYLLNVDCDMLLHQDSGYNWVDSGIKLLRANPEVLCVMPRPGPPTDNGILHQPVPYEPDRAGFFRFNLFSSRAFLIDLKRFERMLPLKIETVQARVPNAGGPPCSNLANWEAMVTSRMIKTGHVRADLNVSAAWTLHPVDRGTHFNKALPRVIKRVEEGWYPPEQAGHYDLILNLWQ